ncbi:RHS repeat protein [Burkholderia anthina]|nr:RHS repeat protein [Burkholderia anthina]
MLTASIDAAGQATRFEYEHATRLTKVINALGESYIYRYDAAAGEDAARRWLSNRHT